MWLPASDSSEGTPPAMGATGASNGGGPGETHGCLPPCCTPSYAGPWSDLVQEIGASVADDPRAELELDKLPPALPPVRAVAGGRSRGLQRGGAKAEEQRTEDCLAYPVWRGHAVPAEPEDGGLTPEALGLTVLPTLLASIRPSPCDQPAEPAPSRQLSLPGVSRREAEPCKGFQHEASPSSTPRSKQRRAAILLCLALFCLAISAAAVVELVRLWASDAYSEAQRMTIAGCGVVTGFFAVLGLAQLALAASTSFPRLRVQIRDRYLGWCKAIVYD